MVAINLTETIKAPPEKVFSLLNDFEKAPQHSNYWKSVKVVKREGNSVTYDTMSEAEGRKMNSTTKVTAQPSRRLDAETVDGDGKGTKMSFVLDPVEPGATKLTLQGDIVLPGFAKLLGGIVKGKIESGMSKELEIIKRNLEQT
ncbi:MAG TPA: SRPBCC family protein [Candidatus Acidoferrales bacterium]|nr:SRPBCC family protein [Candidatus Acidoferrales bacterium]